MVRRVLIPTAVICVLVLLAGCDLLDPARPTPQPDTEVFGSLLDVMEKPDDPGTWVATARVGTPRALARVEAEDGMVIPDVEEGISAEITIDYDTVVLLDGRPTAVGEFNLGTEIVAIPVPGTTVMIGSSRIVLEASYLMDFNSYRAWRLPRLETADDFVEVSDPAAINSAGAEHAPVPLAGGRVLYFSARLRAPALVGGEWNGARREGLAPPAEGEMPVERSYRSELGPDGWTVPELVRFPGLEDAVRVRITWMNEDEDSCLVSVIESGTSPWIGNSSRSGQSASWAELERIDRLGDDALDGVFLAGSATKITFVSGRTGGNQTDLFFDDSTTEDEPLPLEPKVNTMGSEWGPRVGPDNELFFNRGDRQMLLMGGVVSGVRLAGPHRAMINQVAPTSDGRWVFLCIPKLRPVDLDQDIYVAPWNEDRSIGEAVPVDEWRP